MKIKLRQAFDLQMGKTPARNRPDYWNGDHKWISISDIGNAGKFLTKTKESITAAGIDGSGIKVVPQGTVIMSFKLSIGKTAITSEDMYTNEAIMAFIDNGKFAVDTNYLYHLCCGTNWTAETNKAVMGLTLNKATLLEKEIPLPDINEQHEIATKLDKIDALIAERQQQLELIDQAVKSRFIELFGDPLSNDKGWQKVLITEVCHAIFGGGTPSKSYPEYFAGSIPWVSPKDMKSSVISDSIDHITEEAITHSTTNLVPANSVLMVIRSGILKHTLPVAINSVPVTINQDMKAFVPNESIKAAFLMHYFKAVENDVLSGVRGVTADNIDFKAFQKRTIIVPPLVLQEQFATFVEQTDKSKYYSSLSFRYCQAAANTYRQEWMTCRTSDF